MEVVFSVNAPWQDMYKPCIESQRLYCKKLGLEYILLTEEKVKWRHHYCERFYAVELLKQYNRVLYLDADVLITPKAENLFDLCPSECFGAFNENTGVPPMDRNEFVVWRPWPEENGTYRFFNAGVMLFSKEHLPAFDNFRNTPDDPRLFWPWPEQIYLNYLVVNGGLPFYNITDKFNKMSSGRTMTREERLTADFIHYAGPSLFHGASVKDPVMLEDFRVAYLQF